MELVQIVHDFAAGMEAADHRRPQASSSRAARRPYQPGIGPFGEPKAIALTLAEMRSARAGVYANAGTRRYPASRYECDLAIGDLPDWAIEVKHARFLRDNGDEDPAAIKRILSPYPIDHSAVTDCRKLASSSFKGRRAVLIYGFEDPDRPLAWLMDAFEAALAVQSIKLGPREQASLSRLVHPKFPAGRVYAWEVLGMSQCRSALQTTD